jgi:hypothetical protein
MTRSPQLTPDQLLRIEALKIAEEACATTFGPAVSVNFVVARADAYLDFLSASSSPSAPKPSISTRKK